MGARQLRGRLPLVAVVALAVGGVAGGLMASGRSGPPAAARSATSGSAIGLPAARLAVQAQQLQSALAAYAVAAETIRTPMDARQHSVQLRRNEEALALVGRSAARLASLEPGGAPLAIQQGAERLHARAVSLRQAAQSETEGGDGVLALVTFAGEAQRTSARLQSLLAVLAADDSATAYSVTLSAIEREVSRIDPGEGQGDGGAVSGDDPVPSP